MGIPSDIIWIVLAALGGAVVARLLRQPLLIGYIAAGILVGPYTGGATVQDTHQVERLSEIGIALLLFTLGLEFSFRQLKELIGVATIGTLIQLGLSSLAGYLIAQSLGIGWRESLWFGCVISVSSTMVVIKTLGSQGLLNSLSGRIMLGMLVAQDLAIVPMILVLPQITRSVFEYEPLLSAILKSVLFIAFMHYAGTRLFPKMFGLVARSRSRELFFLFTLAVALGIGYITFLLGLSFTFGAFIAGMVLSETDFRHQALSDISSLRDLFGMIFFVSVGMLLNPRFVMAEWKLVFSVMFVVLLAKASITAMVVRAFGYRGAVPLMAGIGLSQIGEFSFAVGSLALSIGQISQDTFSLMIAVGVLTMALTPSLCSLGQKFLKGRGNLFARHIETVVPPGELPRRGHVVIVGGGVMGEYIAGILGSLKIPFIIVEVDHYRVLELKKCDYKVVFGDATNRLVLEAAGIAHAKLLIIACSDMLCLPTIVRESRNENPTVPVVVRVEGDDEARQILDLGISEIVQPKLEAGLEMLRQSLLKLGYKESTIHELLDVLREENHGPSKSSEPSGLAVVD